MPTDRSHGGDGWIPACSLSGTASLELTLIARRPFGESGMGGSH